MPRVVDKARQAHKLASHYAALAGKAKTEGEEVAGQVAARNAPLHDVFSRLSQGTQAVLHVMIHYGHSVGDMEATLATFAELVTTIRGELETVLQDLAATKLEDGHTAGPGLASLFDFVDSDSVYGLLGDLDVHFAHLRRLYVFLKQNLRVVQGKHVSCVRALEDSYTRWATEYPRKTGPEMRTLLAAMDAAAATLAAGELTVNEHLAAVSAPDAPLTGDAAKASHAKVSETVLAMYEAHHTVLSAKASLERIHASQASVFTAGVELAAALVDLEPELASKIALLDNLEFQFSDGLQKLIATYSELHHLTAWYTAFAEAYAELGTEALRRHAAHTRLHDYIASVNTTLAAMATEEREARALFFENYGRFLPSALYTHTDEPQWGVVQLTAPLPNPGAASVTEPSDQIASEPGKGGLALASALDPAAAAATLVAAPALAECGRESATGRRRNGTFVAETNMNALSIARNMLRKGLPRSLKELYYSGTVKGGRFVGKDQFGNEYYEDLEDLYGKNRYVLYGNPAEMEATAVPAEWHSWMCQMKDTPPSAGAVVERKFFEAEHTPNGTGTATSYTATNSLDGVKNDTVEVWRKDSPTEIKPREYPAHF
ncbi:uncharacterized protein AMSG_11975 [Thecamonas trahens ATCC 50062]|uniref:Autophagy protein ATG17-like domain-containing protein n=1 Tax=Thecamonas trahens ATCC 50062 TaxID=461836 RepID=A0A0L0DFX3_THETB|nr:hypothetical protein AMSG_11975 [Thecamonas trahens ATCC 50062]KNC50233.1 hypothetical protein AMSG_11975 [Thecamonas trahens ATCC 50062]|eukprot:XP_013757132.1 hypothetical protein AMSG_11975 [Thecamonas trahens ATCC 50062]